MKDFNTLDQQVNILKNKGLIITEEQDVKQRLLVGNYYNIINGYKNPFLSTSNPDVFLFGATFDEVYALYNFDREIRSVIFPAILSIENILRSLIAYYFSQVHGSSNYLLVNNFDCQLTSSLNQQLKRKTHILELISNIHKSISQAVGNKEYITHYIGKYGFVPLWVLVNDLTFGQLSKFYSLMKQPEKINISKYWNNLKNNDLESFIRTLSFYRNLCAHDDRIYNARSIYAIPDTEIHSELNVTKASSGNYINGKNDFFSLLITFKILLPKEEFNRIVNKVMGRIKSLELKIKTISIDKITSLMGLPFNWYQIK